MTTTVLVIEDEGDKISEFSRQLEHEAELQYLTPSDVGLLSTLQAEGGAIEEQLKNLFARIIQENGIDLVVLDTDLSRDAEFQTHSTYRTALFDLGFPVCRYQKGGSATRFTPLARLRQTVIDGSSAIWLRRELVSRDVANLAPCLKDIVAGFAIIQEQLQADNTLLAGMHSPADVIARIMGAPAQAEDFIGYASQNLTLFGESNETLHEGNIDPARHFATRLGYWLHNFILTFPGPLLTRRQASAFLNAKFAPEHADVLNRVIANCAYAGPFMNLEPRYWRSGLLDLLDNCGGDLAKHPDVPANSFERIDSDNSERAAYVCLLSESFITSEQAAPTPDWIPSGATEAKFSQEKVDELGPLAGI